MNTQNGRKNKEEKKKRGSKVYPPRWTPKLIFYVRTVDRNRNEIETQTKSDFEHPTKKEKMKEKMKENEENERK